jgi:sporulation protein YlmC with PRC-barrel domain
MSMLWMLIVLACVSNTVLVMRGEAAASDVAFPLYKMREILGQAVTTAQGKEVGHIENVIFDAATGDLLYCVVSSGGVLGVGGTLRALPWDVLQGAADRRAFQLQIAEEQFQHAPHFDTDSWPDMMDRHWVDAIHVYYGKTPRLGKNLGPDNAPVAQGPRPVLRAASIVQGTVMNPRGQRLGEIKDVVIDAAAGQVAYVVLAFGDVPLRREKWFALPWQALQQSKGLDTFLLAVDAKELDAAPGFDRDHWPTHAQPLGGTGK